MGLPLVIQILPALGDGGVERSAVDMAAALNRASWPNMVVSSGGEKVEDLHALGVRHMALPLFRKNPLLLPWNVWFLRRLFCAHPGAIVHARSRWPAWCAWLALRLTPSDKRGYFITTYHGTYGHRHTIKRWYNSVMLKGAVVANSAFIARHLTEIYGVDPARITIAPRGVDAALFDPEQVLDAQRRAAEALWGGTQGHKVLCVGRLTRWKGQDVLLRAMALIKDLPWVLVLAGDAKPGDAYKQELADLIEELGLEARVVMAGSRQDVAALNLVADLAVSASVRPEAFGRVAVEAMAMGTPVVATALGGSVETLEDGRTGWLVPVPDAGAGGLAALPQTLAESLKHALTLPPKTLTHMGKTARARVLAHYTSRQTCAAEMAAYRQLLATRRQA